MSIYKSIVEFWFNNRKNWFKTSNIFDNLCKNKFEGLFEKYEVISIDYKDKYQILGKIILLDQLSRNIFRNCEKSYQYDNEACNLTLSNLSLHLEFDGYEKLFFLKPLEHSENFIIQKQNLLIWKSIIDYYLTDYDSLYERHIKIAYHHYRVIEKFNRFPKRNEYLYRKSTKDELKYLKNNKQTFI